MTAIKAGSNKDMNGLKVVNLGSPTSANDAARKAEVDAAIATAISRANHTGSQLASTISDIDTQIRTNRVDQLAAPTGSVSLASQKIINLLDPTAAQDAATKAYVDGQIGGVTGGLNFKGTVRAAVTGNISVTSAPATVDGLTPQSGDIYLLTGNTTGSENGPRVWTAAGAAMNRAPNFDTTGEAILGSFWVVREGTQADKFAIMTNDIAITLNTTALAFIFIGVAPGATAAVIQQAGNGALTSFSVTHNFGSRALNVSVRRVASPWDEIDVYNRCPDLNTVVIEPDAVWTTNEFEIQVGKK